MQPVYRKWQGGGLVQRQTGCVCRLPIRAYQKESLPAIDPDTENGYRSSYKQGEAIAGLPEAPGGIQAEIERGRGGLGRSERIVGRSSAGLIRFIRPISVLF
jgi:hypothetical protein